ncbi:hypothetical protein B0H10DRAFT_2226930 [Mycena sp. CBHHK59/15]|nr:hypothetical protein B0H10DRAFT_2226930 [Mycena sp. CBHHK59/15]
MAITRNSSARSSSPTPSENSDMYYADFDSPLPALSQTADLLSWESDATPAPMDSRDATPTQAAHPSSPASVVEISREEFPPLTTETPATVTKPKNTKAKKGKGKAKAIVAAPHTNDADDPFLAVDIVLATTALLGTQTTADNATDGTSSSCRPAAVSGSPPKRQRANYARDAAPTPLVAVADAASEPDIIQPVITPLDRTLAHIPIPAPTFAQAAAAAPTPAQPAAPTPDQPAAANAALPPMWLTVDGNPPRGSYTPTPTGGFPAIVYSSELLLQGVPADLIRMYEAVPFPKFFLLVSGGNGAVMRTHGLIREAIGNFINVDPTSFTLSTPPTTANGTSPSLWLELLQAILDT